MRVLIVEDSESRIKTFKQKLIGHELVIAMDAPSAYKALREHEKFDYAFLDHDLTTVREDSNDDNGYGVAKWMARHPEKAPDRITIHSLNNVGAANMLRVLGDAGLKAKCAPFAWMHLKPGNPKLGNSQEIEEKTVIILKANAL